MKRSHARYLLGLITMLSLAGCGVADRPAAQSSAMPAATAAAHTDTDATGKPKIASSDTILTIRTQGGHCRYGACWSEKQIKADGVYHAADGAGASKDGTLDDGKIAELTQLIAAANFDQIRSQPFSGICPIAYDGQEYIYTFQTLSGPQTIASCQVAIDEQRPLFQHIAALNEMINQE